MNEEISPKLLAELLLEIKKLNSLLQNQLPVAAPESSVKWAAVSEAYEALKTSGVKSSAHLKRLRQEGVLSERRGEIRNIGKGDRPHWEYNIEKCRTAIKNYFDRLSA